MTDLREALFIRMAEILGGNAEFLELSEVRDKALAAWREIAPEVQREVQSIRDEQQEGPG